MPEGMVPESAFALRSLRGARDVNSTFPSRGLCRSPTHMPVTRVLLASHVIPAHGVQNDDEVFQSNPRT
jgi:hypothetical protein